MATTAATYKGKHLVEYKSFRFQLKSFDADQGTITGYLSTFGNVDEQKDRVLPGAFKKTLQDAYSRKASGRKFLFPLLWMHDVEKPIGGIIEAQEDDVGLLITAQLDIETNEHGIPNNPLATMVFSGFKNGYIDELSMGYVALQKAYDRTGVRDLKEVQLLEGSAVTMLFAANPQALVPASGVKTVCGSTSWPFASRDEEWDGEKADKEIVEWITKSDGTYDFSKLKTVCFYYDEEVLNDPKATQAQKLSCFKLPYCYIVDDKPQIVPSRIPIVAGALDGAHGGLKGVSQADIDGIKKKVAAIYDRMAKEFKDPSMKPPWEQDQDDDNNDKRRHMQQAQRKDFNDLYMASQAEDCFEDWADLINTLTQTMIQIFGMGDSPQSDMTEALEQFTAATMAWCEKAIACNMAQYINDQGYCNDAPYVPSSMQVGGGNQYGYGYYGYMARAGNHSRKEGRAFSKEHHDAIMQQIKCLHGLAAQHKTMSDELAAQFKSAVREHVKAITTSAEDLSRILGSPAYVGDDEQDEEHAAEGRDDSDTSSDDSGNDTGKSRYSMRREPRTALTRKNQPPHASTGLHSMTISDLEHLLS